MSNEVSVPLRGLDIRKLKKNYCNCNFQRVSVPLRGLDIRKPQTLHYIFPCLWVSVPLRGLDIRKLPQESLGETGPMTQFQSPCGD